MSFLPSWLSAEGLLTGLGGFMLVGLCLVIFAECGLLVGFFLPGDSLLFMAGLFNSKGIITEPLWLLCTLLAVCAFIGNMTGYWIGRWVGPKLFNKPDSKLFKQEYVAKTHEFFDKYGSRAIIMARFVPIVRTFITAIAGVGKMDQKKFFTYSAIGGVLWAAGLTVLGHFLGKIEFVRNNIEAMIILIVALSLVPIVIEVVKARREKKHAAAAAGAETQVFPKIDG
nr:VTT domain-containing protein [Kibdelosporangium sp. MJ126-NF4]